MCNLLVTALIIALLLIVSGNVTLNPGPMKKRPKCEKMMPTRSNNCKCVFLLCCVAARVLHVSAFINVFSQSLTVNSDQMNFPFFSIYFRRKTLPSGTLHWSRVRLHFTRLFTVFPIITTLIIIIIILYTFCAASSSSVCSRSEVTRGLCRMDQSDLFTGGHLFHLEYPPGPIVNLPGKV